MRKLNSYIAKSVIGSVAMVLLVILALDVISALVDQLGDMRGEYNFIEVMIYVGLTVPARINEYIPFSALVGCLIGLGMLAGNSELVVMRAAGISVPKITWAVLRPVFIFIALGLVLGEFITPYTDQLAESRRSIALGRLQALETKGVWNKDGDEYVHANAVLPSGEMRGLSRYQFDQLGRLQRSSFAEKALYIDGYWLEHNGSETLFDPAGLKLQTHSYIQRDWHSNLNPELLKLLVLSPEGLSISSLYRYVDYLQLQGLAADKYRLAFWKKVLQPLATASLVLIAVSFIFGPLRETTMGYRIFTGVIVGIVFRTSQDLLGPSSLVFGFQPFIAILIPILICAGFGFYLLRKAD